MLQNETNDKAETFYKEIEKIKSSIYTLLYEINNNLYHEELLIGFFIGYLTGEDFKIEETTIQKIKSISSNLSDKDTNLVDLLENISSEFLIYKDTLIKVHLSGNYMQDNNQINIYKANDFQEKLDSSMNDIYEDINSYAVKDQNSNFFNSNNQFSNFEPNNFLFKSLAKCRICLEEYNIVNEENAFLDCGCVIHSDCFRKYIEYMINQNNIPIKCPIDDCQKDINPNFVDDALDISDEVLKTKYEKFNLRYYLNNNVKDVSCCPTAGCEYFFFYNPEMDKLFYCYSCGERVEWHEGITCEQYKLSVNEDELDKMFFDSANGAKYKRCNNCKFWVEKTEGCNHMRCRCGYDFCYGCGGEYTNSNHSCRKVIRAQIRRNPRKNKKLK